MNKRWCAHIVNLDCNWSNKGQRKVYSQLYITTFKPKQVRAPYFSLIGVANYGRDVYTLAYFLNQYTNGARFDFTQYRFAVGKITYVHCCWF